MAMLELKYVYLSKGKYARFRHPTTGDIRLRGTYPDEAFMAHYRELRARVEQAPVELDAKSFNWLVTRYERSAEFRALADETQKDYLATIKLLRATLGPEPYRLITRAAVKLVRDAYAPTVRKANKITQTISVIYSFADQEELVPEGYNPVRGLKPLRPKGGVQHIAVWSDAEIDRLLGLCPDHIKTAVMIALYTGQRRHDIASMTWGQFQGDIIRVRQHKTGNLLDIACHHKLRAHLEAMRKTARATVICTNEDGLPYTPNGLSQQLRRVVERTPDFPRNRSFHGLKYACGSRMEEAGCTVGQMQAVLGNHAYKLIMQYTTQRVLSHQAVTKMGG